MAAGMVDVRLSTVVRVSLSGDRCLAVLYQVCRVVVLNRRKLRVVERCRSNHLANSIVDAFRLIRERKYVCGEQPKIAILQHETFNISIYESKTKASSQAHRITKRPDHSVRSN